MKEKNTGIQHIFKAFSYSYNGLKAALQSEVALRQDFVVCFILLLVALFLPVGLITRLLLVCSLILILLMELINTAIETVVDRISTDYHELSKKAKDIGSLLVLIAFINAAVVWLSILGNLLFK